MIGKTPAKVIAFNRGPQGGFEAGQHGRRLKAIPANGRAINATIRAFGRTAIARSRFLCVNNPFMAQAKEEFVAALVGDGIKPSFVVESEEVKAELQELWLEWTDESDADGLTDYYGQQMVIANEMFEAGECFVRIRPRRLSDGLSVPMQLQILPSEMVPFEHNMPLPGGGKIECGIEFDAIGRRRGYWFFRNHPGEQLLANLDLSQWLYFVPADQVIHLFKPIRAGQIRGVPHTLAGIVTMALLDLYDDAELERKRTAALFSAFIKRNAGEADTENPLTGAPTSTNSTTGQVTTGMEPGATIELEPGQDVSFGAPADVGGNYEDFQYRNLLRAAAGVGMPYSTVTGDLKSANYSSLRSGMVTFKRRISMVQNSVLIFQFCRPIAKAWLNAAVLGESITTFKASDYAAAPRKYGQRIRWITPKWDWVDPLKDLTAEKLAVDSGFKPRSDVIEGMGYDAHEVDETIAKDQERAASLGLKFVSLKTTVQVSPTADDADIQSLDVPPGGDVPGGNPPDSLIGDGQNDGTTSKPKKKPAKSSGYLWDR